MKHLLPLFIILILSLPTLTFAAAGGVVPCDGPDCQACHVVQLGQNLINWFIGIMATFIALVFVIGGLQMVMSGGNSEGISKGKAMMTNAVIGFFILLGAWLIVDTLLKAVVDNQKLGTWNEIKCVAQPIYATLPPDTGRPVVGGGTSGTLTQTQTAARLAATAQYTTQLCAGVDPQTCNSLRAIMSIESAGNPNAQSPYATGLMQITPGTAKTLDPTLSGLSDAEIKAKLLDPTYNMKLGTQLYNKLSTQYGGDLAKVYAAYNGGPGANLPSANCPGQMRWQCQWDDNAHTIPNTGYTETRNYVANVNAVRCSIPGATGC